MHALLIALMFTGLPSSYMRIEVPAVPPDPSSYGAEMRKLFGPRRENPSYDHSSSGLRDYTLYYSKRVIEYQPPRPKPWRIKGTPIRLPEWYGRPQQATWKDAVQGALFGVVLLAMIVVPLGSAVVFLKPRWKVKDPLGQL